MTSAFAKVILLGEHAVVYGHPALAASIDRTVTASASRSPGPTSVTVAAWALRSTTAESSPPARALAQIASHFDALEGYAVRCETTLVHGAGLGSSAALAVAITGALAEATGQLLAPAQTEAVANTAERVFHDTPSGVDVAVANRGGIGLFRRGEGFTPLALPPLPLVIAISDEPRTTGAMVAGVRDRAAADPRLRKTLEELGALAEQGAALLEAHDLARFGGLMVQAHRALAVLGVCTPRLDALVELALEHGALGAKLTGAGGGGAIIALAPGNEAALVERYLAAGHRAFLANAGTAR